jgi:transcriptional regulator with XRE-family HTH domain
LFKQNNTLENLVYASNSCVDTKKSCRHHLTMSIHSRIKERRIAMGFKSHQALADKIGVSWQTVQLWEKEGGTAPNRKRLDAVADALGVPAEWLRSGSGQASGPPQQSEKAQQANHDLDDVAKLLTFFAQSTPAGRLFILQMAADAEKIVARRDATTED